MVARKNNSEVTQLSDEEIKKNKLKSFNKAVADINKQWGPMTAIRLGENKHMNVKRTSTGSLALDYVIGGGMPDGRIVELFGPEGSGKTSAALQTIANVQKEGGNAAFIDVEHALDPAQAARLGVDVNRLIVSQPEYAEQALDIMDALIRSGGVDIVVLDSIASLVPKKELEGDMEDQQVGLNARIMSKALRKITGATNTTDTKVIFINQVREKIGVMRGNPESTPGGRALKFYATLRIRVSKGQKISSGDKIIGQHVYLKCAKNKVSVPFLTSETNFYWSTGFDMASDVMELGKVAKVFTYTGGVKDLTNNGEPILLDGKKIKSKDAFLNALRDPSTGLLDKYYPIVLKKLEESYDPDVISNENNDEDEDQNAVDDSEEQNSLEDDPVE